MAFTFATVCSGVEGCSLALNAAPPTKGEWEPVFFSEVAPFQSAVLAHHYPNVPNLGDLTKILYKDGEITNGTVSIPLHERLTLLAGGTPCQDFSVAGKRAGGEEGSGTRSSLMWHFLRLVRELSPRAILWENVPGCLSTNGGRDFSRFVSEVGKLGYCVGWRILDCQYSRVDAWPLGIPQRRRRVWLVGLHSATPPSVAQVLFEPPSLLGHTPPSRETRTAALGDFCSRFVGTGFAQNSYSAYGADNVSASLKHCGGTYGGGSECLIVKPDHGTAHDTARCLQGGHDGRISDSTNIVLPINGHTVGRIDGGSNGFGVGDERDPSFTLTTADRHCIAGFIPNASTTASTIGYEEEVSATQRGQQVVGILDKGYVRRLTPLECERLMGYPENYTRIPYRGKPAEDCPDTPRYEACGNGWAINSARWVLLGIHQFLTNEKGVHQ